MPWYTDFFTELPNTFWRAAVPIEATSAEVDFVLKATGLPPAGALLDVACGSGRHALEFARRGLAVTGIDVSAEAIAFASASGIGTFLVGDMGSLPAGLSADAVICMGNAFGYLPHDGTVGFLARAREIAPVLVLDTGFVAESFLPGLRLDEEPMTIGGVEATSVNEYDAANSAWITHFVFRRGEDEHRGTSVQHVYTSGELVRLCRAAGYSTVDLYGSPDGEPYGFGSPRLLLVAR